MFRRQSSLQALILFLVISSVRVPSGHAQTDVNAAERDDESIVAFVNVAVISMQDETVLEAQTVLIRGDRIQSIVPVNSLAVSPQATVIDGTGRYLIPGLADMHVHVRAPFDDGPLYLNAGVTTVLSLGTAADAPTWELLWQKILDERDRSRTPAFVGPTLYTVGALILGGETPEEADRIVRENAQYGFDFVKVHGDVSPEAFDRLQNTALRMGIRVTGHAQRKQGMQPVYAHQQDLVHVEEYLYASFNPATPGFWRATGGSVLVLGVLLLVNLGFGMGTLWRRVRKRESAGHSPRMRSVRRWLGIFTGVAALLLMAICMSVTEPLPGIWAGGTMAVGLVGALMLLAIFVAGVLTMRMQRAWRDEACTIPRRIAFLAVGTMVWTFVACSGSLTPRSWRTTQGALERIAERTAEAGIWVTPTLVVLDYNKRQNTDEFFALIERPEMQYLRPDTRDRWINHNPYRRPPPFTGMQFAIWQSWTDLTSRLTAELHSAGVPLLAGSDAIGPPGLLPGSSLHEELSLLVQVGLSPYEALKTATVNPAVYLGEALEFGTIAEGLRADLVLLTGNPLEDIDNTRTRVGVMKRGRWFPAGELEAALAQLAEARK